jgi:hypothetical protein
MAALRRAARKRAGPLPSIDVADALLDERGELTDAPHAAFLGSHPSVQIFRGVARRLLSRIPAHAPITGLAIDIGLR